MLKVSEKMYSSNVHSTSKYLFGSYDKEIKEI